MLLFAMRKNEYFVPSTMRKCEYDRLGMSFFSFELRKYKHMMTMTMTISISL
jgi:hypothetical protein